MFPYFYIFGRPIGTYGLCMLAGFLLAFVLSLRKGRRCGLLFEDLLICAALAMGFGMVGGNLLYVFVTYPLKQIVALITAGDLRFLGSGIVFYGGLIGGILGGLLGLRIAKCKFETVVRCIVPYIPLGHAIGRVGCVMAGCCHGFSYDGPFALYYPHSVSGLSPEQGYFPVQLLEALVNIIICLFLCCYEKKAKRASNLLFAYLGMYAVSRFLLEMLRGDAIRGVWHTISTSQIISLILLAISLTGFLWNIYHKK